MDWLLLRTSSWVGALEMYPHFRFIAVGYRAQNERARERERALGVCGANTTGVCLHDSYRQLMVRTSRRSMAWWW